MYLVDKQTNEIVALGSVAKCHSLMSCNKNLICFNNSDQKVTIVKIKVEGKSYLLGRRKK
jgi:hypothetical protein